MNRFRAQKLRGLLIKDQEQEIVVVLIPGGL
jgi:hypothetical protein